MASTIWRLRAKSGLVSATSRSSDSRNASLGFLMACNAAGKPARYAD